MANIILAVVGLPGAGKTEATNYLMGKTSWPKIYFGQAVVDEAARRGTPGEAGERQVREQMRAEHGMAAMAIANMTKIKELFEQGSTIIESMYSWEEYLELKKHFGENFKVLAIYSSFATRVKRLGKRPERPLTEQEVESRDSSQIENTHQAGPIARADWTIVNEGSKGELFENIDKVISVLTA